MRTHLESAMVQLINDGWHTETYGDMSAGDPFVASVVYIDGAESDPIGTPLEDEDERKALADLDHGYYVVIEDSDGLVTIVGTFDTGPEADAFATGENESLTRTHW